ncbi:hypothetical protein P167DRAFT_569854 [Morchella conica CCBAS932]|uniref:Uncharacterized protein n=1 Tax=Morchella conica CCBAS932 TaxID=1392247 RepID=A0A3N4L4B3_9PEZI|nr:hypothetical protein P167DRAFT_569854 [Morchella conica CCBAS932]
MSVYGSVVDAFDAAPAMYVAPSALPSRDSGTLAVDGEYTKPFTGSLWGTELLFYRGSYLNITGKGYFQVRWEVAWFNTYGALVPPTWTGLTEKLFHVASGGGRRMDDAMILRLIPTQPGWGP